MANVPRSLKRGTHIYTVLVLLEENDNRETINVCNWLWTRTNDHEIIELYTNNAVVWIDRKGTKQAVFSTDNSTRWYSVKRDNVKNHENETVPFNKSQSVTQSVKEWCVVATAAVVAKSNSWLGRWAWADYRCSPLFPVPRPLTAPAGVPRSMQIRPTALELRSLCHCCFQQTYLKEPRHVYGLP